MRCFNSVPRSIGLTKGAVWSCTVWICAALLFSGAPTYGQTAIDRDVLAKIRSEAQERSQVSPVFDMFTVTIGPRLTASPAQKRAAEYARDRLLSYGLDNAHLEPWHFGRGWTLEKLTVEMIEPRYLPVDRLCRRMVALHHRRNRRGAGLDRRQIAGAGRRSAGVA